MQIVLYTIPATWLCHLVYAAFIFHSATMCWTVSEAWLWDTTVHGAGLYVCYVAHWLFHIINLNYLPSLDYHQCHFSSLNGIQCPHCRLMSSRSASRSCSFLAYSLMSCMYGGVMCLIFLPYVLPILFSFCCQWLCCYCAVALQLGVHQR